MRIAIAGKGGTGKTTIAGTLARVLARKGPALAQVFIAATEPPRALPPRDGVFVKNRFRGMLGFGPL